MSCHVDRRMSASMASMRGQQMRLQQAARCPLATTWLAALAIGARGCVSERGRIIQTDQRTMDLLSQLEPRRVVGLCVVSREGHVRHGLLAFYARDRLGTSWGPECWASPRRCNNTMDIRPMRREGVCNAPPGRDLSAQGH